ncbi:glycosyltransferase [Microbulbifer sp. YPW16]|uniref:glycosyltransferase n=1 Tax=Microbulbifer sp. YPW16 TaxID=2904242 RepID=UPI001E42D23B|nr:glycosyltransferase family A protein [Microbulbifer sp. YPW16]UHQ54107.1 glycosyltransferase family 2 protein [Microbulbifer sp. YPW16]
MLAIKEKPYVIISPCRDEEEYLENTLHSVINQTVPPTLWLIVDDGSTDRTPEILERYREKYDFIRVLRRDNRGFRNVGPGVVDAFYAGLEEVQLDRFDFICKLDLDVELPSRYFETLLQKMTADPRLGCASGKPYNMRDGRLVSERRGDEMSVGMTKFYRTQCFREIGGIVREVMWDAIDCHRARMLGWRARSWDEPDLRFIHLRIMGSSQRGILTGKMRHGYGQYFMGTGFLYLAATAVFRIADYPFMVGSMAVLWGYLRSWLSRKPRFPDREFINYLRAFQLYSLVAGKRRAIEKYEAAGLERWKSARRDNNVQVSGGAPANA